MYFQTYNVHLVMKNKPIKSGVLSICSVIYSTREFSTSKIKMTIKVITYIMEIIQKFLQRFISLGNDDLSAHEPLPHT
jgi:Na+-transporting NADH:ubiquinone oxidoreductase subunit NqrD